MSRRQFGNVRKLPSGAWQARYRDLGGREHVRSLETRRLAGVWLAEAQADLARGTWRSPEAGQTTFGDYARSWLASRVDLKPTTRQNYTWVLGKLVRDLGGYALEDLTPVRIRAWYAEFARTQRVTPTRQAYALLRAILNGAVDDELILRNPCRIRGAGSPQHPERPTATLSQINALAEAVPERYRALVLTAAWTGARWGELIALTQDRLDARTGRMRIDRQLSLLRKGDGGPVLVEQTPKTAAGNRTVHVPPHLLPLLAAHLLEHVPAGCPLVFPNSKGEPINRYSFASVWGRAREKAGMPGFHFHDLRHTGNTLAATTGASTKELMHRMGHSSVRAALIYQHATDERDAVIAQALSELAGRAGSTNATVTRLVGGRGDEQRVL
ncbi:MAG TPA: site-specific integrase [Mycobacteriales bacterium]|nr:site-specific integrase [Mycobacteriales bacterium]